MDLDRGIFQKVEYSDLNAKQQEVYNFQHIANLLAKYGYAAYPIRDDWNGGDMFARHMKTGEPMTVQIKGRVTFDRKYMAKKLWIGFPSAERAYVYPHDQVLEDYLKLRDERGQPLDANLAWSRDGLVHWGSP